METALHQSGNVLVTTARTVIDGKTYSAKHITAVTSVEYAPKTISKTCLGIIGLIFLSCSAAFLFMLMPYFIVGNSDVLIPSLVCVIPALALGIILAGLGFLTPAPKPTYGVRIATASGEVDVLRSPDEALIHQIVRAVQTSIVQ